VDLDAANPTARALRCLELVQAQPGITADQLGDRLGVTGRAARRYVATLRDAGIPIDATTGPYGGYRLGRGRRPPPLMFTSREALALVMAVLDGHHDAAAIDDPVGAALGKLVSALPDHVGSQAAAMRRYALAAPDRRAVRPDPGVSSDLVDAIASGRRVRLGYRSERGSTWDAEVDPWAIVIRHGRWYLLCFAHHAEAQRSYRVDRIERVDVLATAARVAPPDGFEPVAVLEEQLGSGWEHETHVVFEAPLRSLQPLVGRPMGRLTELDDRRCELIGTTSNPEMYAGEWLAAIPFPFTVVGGDELRDAVRTIAERFGAALE
jgi:predicted DNA-binding transcriptional regulator YafY